MAFGTYYITVGSTPLPNKFIAKDSFKASLRKREANRWTDINGEEHVEYYPYQQLMAEFTTCNLTDDLAEELAEIFADAFDVGTRKCTVTVYVRELDDYITQAVDVSEFEPVLSRATSSLGNIWKQVKITLKGRGGAVS